LDYEIIMDVSGDLDSRADISREVVFLSMEYTVNDETRVCGGLDSAQAIHEFYDAQRGGALTRTSQISPFMYQEFLTPRLEQGKSCLYLSLSSGLSSTYQSALMAKEELKQRFPQLDFCPVDTRAASGGMGVIAERAVRNRAAGMSIEENQKDLETLVKRVKHWFLVQDLMYLKRGGRVSAATAIVGTALNIKPILTINEAGRLDTVAKKRGRQASAYVLERFFEDYDPESGDPVYVIHADAAATAEYFANEIAAKFPQAVIRISTLSPVIGSHTGPDMAAICYTAKA